MSEAAPVVIIGAGPAGLMAADVLSAAGRRVIVCERMPSVARKFLMAGRGGLNLTHSEPFAQFVTRYGDAQTHLQPMLDAFTPDDLIAWAEALGQDTFVGSSGRVFPRAMKASPLLRALLARLGERGVEIRTRLHWEGWDGDALAFTRANGAREILKPSATLLALGGASWPRLGADGGWTAALSNEGVALSPFAPSNGGFTVQWSDHFRERFAGQPLKGVAVMHHSRRVRGEVMITHYGVEGSPIYALSRDLRETAPTILRIDLRPDLRYQDVESKLSHAKAGDTLSSTLRKTLNLSPIAISLLYENTNGPPRRTPKELAAAIKAVHLAIGGPHTLDRAISSAGGVRWDAVSEQLELKALPGVYVAGEMLDWEAPTGGYLLQASFATGAWAAHAILAQNAR